MTVACLSVSALGAVATLAADPGEVIPVMAVGGGLLLGLVGMITTAVRKNARDRERELSRREIAAYVAEGTMSAEDGERLLNAGPKEPKA